MELRKNRARHHGAARVRASAGSSGNRETLFDQDTGALRQPESQIRSVFAPRAGCAGLFLCHLMSVILLLCCFCNGGHPFSIVVTTLLSATSVSFYLSQLLTTPCVLFAVVIYSYLLNSAEPNLMSHSQTLSRHVKRTFTVLESLHFVCQRRRGVLHHIQSTWH